MTQFILGGVFAFLGLLMGALTLAAWQMVWRDWHDEAWRSMRGVGAAVATTCSFAAVSLIGIGVAMVLRAVL